jgi:hypothetical protein
VRNSAPGSLGKALPFGVGAVSGGVGSFTFGRDVVKAAHIAFPEPPADFPPLLADFQKPEPKPAEPSRAVVALQAAAGGVANFGEDVWGTATKASEVFRSVDLDGDGIPDEARAFTAVRGAGSAFKGAAAGAAGAVGGVFRRKRDRGIADEASDEPAKDPAES